MIGETIGRYRVEALLGRGAMGEVYRAIDPAIGRAVAIKVVRLDSAMFDATDELLARFRQEARSAGRLKHHNIVAIYDYGEEDGDYYLVMEHIEGTSLAERVAESGPMPPEEACAAILQACAALGVAHRKGIVHRDVKPANLMIEAETGLLKILDFGVAKLEASDLTATGTVFGTPSYMSPEQILGRHLDARTDLFSLGAVFHELLTGHKAFPGDHMATVSYRIVNEEPAGYDEIPTRFGEGYAYALGKALAKDPAERFQSSEDMSEAIQTYCLGAASAPGPPRPAPAAPDPVAVEAPAAIDPSSAVESSAPSTSSGDDAKDRRPWLIAGALVAVLLVGVGAWAMFGDGGHRSRPAGGAIATANGGGGADPPIEPATDPLAGVDSAAPVSATLDLSVDPDGARILVDGRAFPADSASLSLDPGPHRVQVQADGHVSADTTVTLEAGATLALALELAEEVPEEPAEGTLSVTANVPGTVFIGRSRLGATPIRGRTVRAGTYTLQFVPEGDQGRSLAKTTRVSVPPGGSRTATFTIDRGFLTVGVGDPGWAFVVIDGRRVRETPLIRHPLSVGAHVVRLERDGYETATRTVEIRPAETVRWTGVALTEGGK